MFSRPMVSNSRRLNHRLPGGILALALVLSLFATLLTPTPALAVDDGLLFSASSNRAGAEALTSARVDGVVHVFAKRTSGLRRVFFYVDDPQRRRPSHRVDSTSVYTLSDRNGLDTRDLKNGTHKVTARFVSKSGRDYTITAPFVVANNPSPQPEPAPEPTEEPAPEPTEDRGVQEAPAGSRGLHYTPAELAAWRSRAAEGPYRSSSDASTNSPADWIRIVENKNAFMNAPVKDRWAPDWGSGPIPTTTGERHLLPDPDYTTRLRDAGFYALVKDDATVGRAVIRELLAQYNEPKADVSNRNRFPAGKGRVRDTNPYFMSAAGFTSLLFAGDYVKGYATAREIAEMRAWHRHAAEWMLPDTVNYFNKKYADRDGGDYSPRLSANNDDRAFIGGPQTTIYGRIYNNRWAVMELYLGLVGLDQDLPALQREAKLFFKEWVRFGVYPTAGSYAGTSWNGGGFLAELERATTSGAAAADLGWSYSINTLNITSMIADHFARAGDTSLYDYSTREGLWGTEAGPRQEPKSLLFALREMSKHTSGRIRRYAPAAGGRSSSDWLVNGHNPTTGWDGVQDVGFSIPNLYYQDPFLQQTYLRQGDGFKAYPRNPAPNARGVSWQGHWGMYPAVLFQAGGLEGVVNPY